jgi:hypothetical protein
MPFLAAQVNIAGIPGDLIGLLAVGLALLLFGIAGGQRFSMAFLFALYVAAAVVTVVPSLRAFLLRVGLELPNATPAITFIVVLLGATWLLAGSAMTALLRFEGKGVKAWWKIGLASVLGSGLFGVFFFSLLPGGSVTFSNLVSAWVLGPPMPFIWALAPILFFVIFRAER